MRNLLPNKKLSVFIISSFLVLFLLSFVSAVGGISQEDKAAIDNKLEILSQSLTTTGGGGPIESVSSPNEENLNKVVDLVDSNKVALQQEIRKKLEEVSIESFKVKCSPLEEHLEVKNHGKVRVECRTSSSGPGWEVSGVPAYFKFTKKDNSWYITDTNFHKKIGIKSVWKSTKKIFLIIMVPLLLIVLIPLAIFWIWMFIDCLKRDFEDKTLWVIILIFLSAFGAVLYFFLVRIKDK